MTSNPETSALFSFFGRLQVQLFGDNQFVPEVQRPSDVIVYGIANDHVQRAYKIKESQRRRLAELQCARGRSLSLINEYEKGAATIGEALEAYMKAAADPEYRHAVATVVALEKGIRATLPFRILAEATYNAEVLTQFPAIGGLVFDIDAEWTVFRIPSGELADIDSWMDQIERSIQTGC